jgi:hypothetical protein
MRTSISSVTFTRPFLLPGFDGPHAPGSFEVRTDEERLDTTVEAWLRVGTSILIVDGGFTQAWPVTPRDLDAALKADRAKGRPQ